VVIAAKFGFKHATDIRSRNARFTPEAIKANRVVIDLLE